MQKIRFRLNCIRHVSILAFLWTAGLLIGLFIPFRFPMYVSLMRQAYACPVSIVGLIIILILPLLIAGLACSARSVIIYLFISLKAFAQGAAISGSVIIYGSGAWLVHILFLFSDLFFNVVFLWFVFGDPVKQRSILHKEYIIALLCVIVMGFWDYQFISPFLVSVLTR